jgi:hypothetical protein
VQVAVADAAEEDGDLHVGGQRFAALDGVRGKGEVGVAAA